MSALSIMIQYTPSRLLKNSLSLWERAGVRGEASAEVKEKED